MSPIIYKNRACGQYRFSRSDRKNGADVTIFVLNEMPQRFSPKCIVAQLCCNTQSLENFIKKFWFNCIIAYLVEVGWFNIQ